MKNQQIKSRNTLNNLNTPNNILVIHHDKDADGIVSGLLAIDFWTCLANYNPNLKVDIIGYNYEPTANWMNQVQDGLYDYIQFIDVTPPIEWLKQFHEPVEQQIPIDIFDHHTNKCYEIQNLMLPNVRLFFDSSMCGALIYFQSITRLRATFIDKIPNIKPSFLSTKNVMRNKQFKACYNELMSKWLQPSFIRFVTLVSQYDTWVWYDNWKQQSTTESLEPKYLSDGITDTFFNNQSSEIQLMYSEYSNRDIQTAMSNWIATGKRIWSEESKQAAQANIAPYMVNNRKVYLTTDKYNFHITERVKNEFGDNAIIFVSIKLDKNIVSLSARTVDDEFDSANFIKLFCERLMGSGGGHRFAAGGRIPLYSIGELFKHRINEE